MRLSGLSCGIHKDLSNYCNRNFDLGHQAPSNCTVRSNKLLLGRHIGFTIDYCQINDSKLCPLSEIFTTQRLPIHHGRGRARQSKTCWVSWLLWPSTGRPNSKLHVCSSSFLSSSHSSSFCKDLDALLHLTENTFCSLLYRMRFMVLHFY